MVCKLLKVLYGLKQSLYFWYKRLLDFLLQKLSFSYINADHNIFIISIGLDGPIVRILIDNIKIIKTKGSEAIQKVRSELVTTILIVDIGLISFYLGPKV